MKLSDAMLRTLTTPGRHFDGGGLYLEVSKSGGRYWRLKYRFGGKEKRLAFGTYPEVSLDAARELRDDARRILARGEDPAEVRRAAKAGGVLTEPDRPASSPAALAALSTEDALALARRAIDRAYDALDDAWRLSEVAYEALPNSTEEDRARAVLRGLEALCLGQMESLRRTAERIAEGRP